MSETRPVGFIGLGLMGGPMAINLCRAGHDVRIWNRSPGRYPPVTAAGATVAASPADIARTCDTIFICVFDTAAVRDVLFGDDGVAAGVSAGAVVVDHSTIDPAAAVELAARLHAERGATLIDAPVTGGVVGAKNGTLTVFAGGDADAIDRIRPIAAPMASRIEHMGPSGAGQTVKMCNQVMVQTTLAAMAEMFKLAEAGGVDATRLPDVFAGGAADSRVMTLFGERMVTRGDTVTGPLGLCLKDLDLIAACGKSLGCALPISGVATELFRMAAAMGLRDLDGSQLIRLYDREAPRSDSVPHHRGQIA